jgi:hypothetical protein
MRLRRVDTLPEERIFLRAQLPAIAFSFFHPDTRSSGVGHGPAVSSLGFLAFVCDLCSGCQSSTVF